MTPNVSGNRVEYQEPEDIEPEERQFKTNEVAESEKMYRNRANNSFVTSCLDNTFKINLLQLLFWMKYYVKQTYVFIWRK